MKPKYSQIKKSHTFLAAGLLTASFVVTPSAQAANWSGNVGNWSSNSSPGWNGTGVPNAVGAVANFNALNMTPTQDISGGVTVGTLSFTTNTTSVNVKLAATNGITLNQDGSGSGRATIINTNSSASSAFMGIESGTLTLADDLLISNTGNSTNTLTNGGAIRIAAAIGGTGNITIDNVLNNTSTGAGTIRLAGTNSFTGSVNVRSGLTAYTNSSAFGNAANVITLGAEGVGSASLMANAAVTVANNWVVAAGSTGTLTLGSFGTNALTLNGNGTLNGNITFLTGATDANRMKMNGVISGTGNITISSPGSGFVELINANTYSGSTTVSSGILRLTNALAMQNSALDTTNSVTGTGTAGFQYRPASGTTLTLGGLTGNKDLASVFATGTGSFSGGYVTITALTLNPGTGVTRTYSAAITNGANNMSLTKTGLGTQVLSGTNTYNGATTVSAGTLVVEGSISTSTTTVQSGATLGGSGTVGGLTVNSGAFHTPGSSPGIQNTGNYSNAGTLAIEINGATIGTDYDQVNTTGTVSLSGVLSITMSYTPADNALFFILANDGVDAISGTFSNASVNGHTYTLGGQDFAISYFGDSATNSFTGGNDVVLRAVVVPEPRAALLGSLGMLMLLRRRR